MKPQVLPRSAVSDDQPGTYVSPVDFSVCGIPSTPLPFPLTVIRPGRYRQPSTGRDVTVHAIKDGFVEWSYDDSVAPSLFYWPYEQFVKFGAFVSYSGD